MKKQTLFSILVITFAILTFCGAGYVLYNRGQVNAGFAVIPMVIELVFLAIYRAEKTKISKF